MHLLFQINSALQGSKQKCLTKQQTQTKNVSAKNKKCKQQTQTNSYEVIDLFIRPTNEVLQMNSLHHWHCSEFCCTLCDLTYEI